MEELRCGTNGNSFDALVNGEEMDAFGDKKNDEEVGVKSLLLQSNNKITT